MGILSRRSNHPAQRPRAGLDLREAGHPSDATPERCGAKLEFLARTGEVKYNL